MSAHLACPECRGSLARGPETLECARCGVFYPQHDGIAEFCASDAFYEEYLDEHCPFVREPAAWKAAILRVLPYWSWREWKFFRKHVRPGATILDLGCARGKEWFSSRGGFVAGVDPIRAPLAECAEHYDLVAQAEIVRLPFPDGVFDYVVTSHVLGHVPHEQKEAALSEIARVLKTGGLSLNIIETDSTHRFVELGKSDSELYRRNFVETDGHVGLELPSAVLDRFRSHGFSVVDVEKMESGVVHLRYYGKYLGKGYPALVPAVRRRMRWWDRIEGNPVMLGAYEVAMGSYHRLVEPWRTSLDDAMFIALAAVKERAAA